jgi:hypothetical protein
MLLILVTHDYFPTSADCVSFFRLLPLYFPRDKHEEDIAALKLPADVGDENGETVIDERKIRIKPLPAGDGKTPIPALADIPLPDSGLTKRMRWVYKCMYFSQFCWLKEITLKKDILCMLSSLLPGVCLILGGLSEQEFFQAGLIFGSCIYVNN